MTAPLPPNADELVSAYVDGAAAPDEVAIVEASPELMARVEALQEVTGFLAGPVAPPGETTREQHLAAALGEFDRLFAAGEFDGATSEVVDEAPAPTLLQAVPDPAPSEVAAASAPEVASLAEARERKQPRRLNLVVAAAAAVALLFAGIVAVGLNSGESRDVVDGAESAVTAADDAADAAEDAPLLQATESDAMVEEEAAFDEDEAFAASAADLDDAARAEPAPTAPPAAAAESNDAMDDAAMADAEPELDAAGDEELEETEEAVDAEAADDADAAAGTAADAGPAGVIDPEIGTFGSIPELVDATIARLAGDSPTVFAEQRFLAPAATTCPDLVADLGIDPGALIGLADLDGRIVELHANPDDQIIVIAVEGCELVTSFVAG